MGYIEINRKVVKEVFEYGPRKLMGKGLKYVEIKDVGEFVFGNGKILGFFYSDFEQFTAYAFGGRKLLNKYKFYLEDGTPLTNNYYIDWFLESVEKIKEKHKKKLKGLYVLIAKDSESEDWYMLLSNGKKVEEKDIWNEK